ncbi:MAG: carboxymuconolactone decarboxylase family protein [Acidobacteria bacterium]|nr:carboxymuconolactone decarboxylase family protein [Acidobacteriota bacterium]
MKPALLFGLLVLAVTGQPRFPQRILEEMKGDERALAERFMKETRTGIAGPWNVMLRSPAMSVGLLDLYNYFRWKSTLPKRLMELAIMTAAREWSVQFEWFAHYPISLKEGISPDLLAELRVGKRPLNMKPDEAIVYDFTRELCRNHFVSDATFQKTKQLLGEQNLVDLTSLVGTYLSIGALLNVGQVPGAVKEGGPDWLPPIKR